jgi:hypothetical protein
MVEIVEDGSTVRIITRAGTFLRVLARVGPALGALSIIIAGVALATDGPGDAIRGAVPGVLLALGTLWLGRRIEVTIDAATRTVRVRSRYPFLPGRETALAFVEIRKIELFRDSWRRDPWISLWLHDDHRSVRVAGPLHATPTNIAVITRASELARAKLDVPITGSLNEPPPA